MNSLVFKSPQASFVSVFAPISLIYCLLGLQNTEKNLYVFDMTTFLLFIWKYLILGKFHWFLNHFWDVLFLIYGTIFYFIINPFQFHLAKHFSANFNFHQCHYYRPSSQTMYHFKTQKSTLIFKTRILHNFSIFKFMNYFHNFFFIRNAAHN